LVALCAYDTVAEGVERTWLRKVQVTRNHSVSHILNRNLLKRQPGAFFAEATYVPVSVGGVPFEKI